MKNYKTKFVQGMFNISKICGPLCGHTVPKSQSEWNYIGTNKLSQGENIGAAGNWSVEGKSLGKFPQYHIMVVSCYESGRSYSQNETFCLLLVLIRLCLSSPSSYFQTMFSPCLRIQTHPVRWGDSRWWIVEPREVLMLKSTSKLL